MKHLQLVTIKYILKLVVKWDILNSAHRRILNEVTTSPNTSEVLRWGVSTGGVNFATCFLPKSASCSFTAAILVSTGYVDQKIKNKITGLIWTEGRNNCNASNCLNRFDTMPERYRNMGADLEPEDKFISMIIAREPMDRLVSCWRDKISRRS